MEKALVAEGSAAVGSLVISVFFLLPPFFGGLGHEQAGEPRELRVGALVAWRRRLPVVPGKEPGIWGIPERKRRGWIKMKPPGIGPQLLSPWFHLPG